MGDRELITFLSESEILNRYRRKYTTMRNAFNLEFVESDNDGSPDGKFRDDFALHLRNVNIALDRDLNSRRWGQEETYDNTQATVKNNARSDLSRPKNGPQGSFGRNNRYRSKSIRVNNGDGADDVGYNNSWWGWIILVIRESRLNRNYIGNGEKLQSILKSSISEVNIRIAKERVI